MKKTLILLLIMISINVIAQSYTEKYNSLYNRYELFDGNDNLIGYKKWNSLYNRYDIEYFNRKTETLKKEYIQPYDFDLLQKTLEYKQNTYNSNTERIQNEINYLTKLFTILYENRKEIEVSRRLEQIIQKNNELERIIKKINNANLDYSYNGNLRKVLNLLSKYEVYVKNTINEVVEERKTAIKKANKKFKVYYYPVVKKSNKNNITIQRIVVTKENFRIYLKAINRYDYDAWICILKETYIENSTTKEKKYLINSIDMPISPKKHYYKTKNEYLEFTLIFPKLNNCDNFNLIECNDNGCINLKGITLK